MTPCIEFTGCIGKTGYGRKGRGGKVYNAHHLVWIDAHGPVPEGMVVHHKCENKRCVNLDHLTLLDHFENLELGVKHNSKKTHCPRGHEYSGKDSRGRRICQTCVRIRYHERTSR